MTRQLLAATILLVAGALNFQSHLSRPPTLEDYLAFRCGPGNVAETSISAGHFFAAAGHCWGCYAMAIGAAWIAISASTGFRRGAKLRAPRQ